MLYTIYIGLSIFALIVMIVAIIGQRFSAQARTVMCLIAFGVFALTAVSSYDVTDTYIDGSGVVEQVLLMEGHNADAMALLNFLACIISFIMFVVYLLLSIADYRTPLWRKRIDAYNRQLSNE